jgi:hypothetical protein
MHTRLGFIAILTAFAALTACGAGAEDDGETGHMSAYDVEAAAPDAGAPKPWVVYDCRPVGKQYKSEAQAPCRRVSADAGTH